MQPVSSTVNEFMHIAASLRMLTVSADRGHQSAHCQRKAFTTIAYMDHDIMCSLEEVEQID
eukprot:scaffold52279_cov18-Prasinocladus_malaysianus.AAC.1